MIELAARIEANHAQLDALPAARELTREIYRLSRQGGFARDAGLRDQVRRAAVSIMSA